MENVIVETDPFPYILVEDILPEDFYLALSNSWPEECLTHSPTFATHWRRGLKISDPNWLKREAYSHDLWKEFVIFVVNGIIRPKIGDLFRKYSYCRFGRDVNVSFSKRGEDQIFEDIGNGISPHIDSVTAFAALCVYFPDINDHQHMDLGTHFYRNVDGMESIDTGYAPLEKCRLVKVTPYRPNTLCAFMQTPHSWHGTSLHNPYVGYKRRLYFGHIFLTPQFLLDYYGQQFGPNLDEDHAY